MSSPDGAAARDGDPCRPLVATASDGARLEGCPHGGHLTRWWPAGEVESRLWLSPLSECRAGTAIRGGVPVIFPQFGSLGPLRKHGLVRDVAWQRQSHHSGDAARLAFHTRVEPAQAWPHQALLTLAGQAAGDRLSISLRVENCGDAPFGFTGALHTYLAVSRSRAASLEGLAGCRAIDALDGGMSTVLGPGPLSAVGPRDVMVRGAPDTVTLHDADRPPMGLVSTGFGSWVVWNPGPGHDLVDVDDGDEAHFVCVEPAVLDPVTLDPGQAWLGSLTLTVHR